MFVAYVLNSTKPVTRGKDVQARRRFEQFSNFKVNPIPLLLGEGGARTTVTEALYTLYKKR
jgi:hypothetical protein